MTDPRNHRLPPTPPYGMPPAARPATPAAAAVAGGRAATAKKRRNPARGAKVVALLSSVAATLGVAGVLERGDGLAAPATAAPPGPAASPAASSAAPSTSSRHHRSPYADGTYLGTAQPTKWGPVQVQATIASGRIVSVEEVVRPSDRRSQNINAQAAPILEQEALAIQSADLDAVSGATWTSRTYTASLQAALDRARSAQGTTS